MLWTEMIRGLAEVLGKFGHATHVGGNGRGCVVANLKVIQHSLS